jgi:hypothetical protein
MIVIGTGRIGCSAKVNKSTCGDREPVRLSEGRVVSVLGSFLLAPDVVAGAVEAYRLQRECTAQEYARRRRDATREIGMIGRKIAMTLS